MIPKKIHYCWFGKNELPEKARKCINSWKKYCPDYEIIEWNETNIDINMNPYTRMCYEEKKFAFLTDYIRLVVIQEYGGIYMDTDVEVVKNLNPLLENEAYFGFEDKDYVNTGMGFGAVADSPVVDALIREYNELLDGKKGVISCPLLNTRALIKKGLKLTGEEQKFADFIVLPTEYLNPYDSKTGRLNKTENTYSIHWYAMSWFSTKMKLQNKITQIIHRIFGVDFSRKIKYIFQKKV